MKKQQKKRPLKLRSFDSHAHSLLMSSPTLRLTNITFHDISFKAKNSISGTWRRFDGKFLWIFSSSWFKNNRQHYSNLTRRQNNLRTILRCSACSQVTKRKNGHRFGLLISDITVAQKVT